MDAKAALAPVVEPRRESTLAMTGRLLTNLAAVNPGLVTIYEATPTKVVLYGLTTPDVRTWSTTATPYIAAKSVLSVPALSAVSIAVMLDDSIGRLDMNVA